jgi:hypothetical protein
MLHVGVDEVGYGPLLGPLVVGIAAFRLTDHPEPGEANLLRRLRGLVVRRPKDAKACAARRLPVPVDDSKVIHRRFGLSGLARGVGLFASAMDAAPPATLEDLLVRFSDLGPERFEQIPWYRRLDLAAVPRYPWTGPLEDRFLGRQVQALDLRVWPLAAADFNQEVERHGNKATVLGLAAGAALLSVLDRHPAEDAEIVFDRQGGRLDYAGYLTDLFPFAAITKRAAPAGESRYEVDLPSRRLFVRFATRADTCSLAVSWASMAAKLARELFMERMNAFFGARQDALRPTAGYTVDGRRWLGDVAAVLAAEGIDPDTLVRSR